MLENVILVGFELALPPERFHDWYEYKEFVPQDSDKVMLTKSDEDFTVRG